jgi:hypothetical protein
MASASTASAMGSPCTTPSCCTLDNLRLAEGAAEDGGGIRCIPIPVEELSCARLMFFEASSATFRHGAGALLRHVHRHRLYSAALPAAPPARP